MTIDDDMFSGFIQAAEEEERARKLADQRFNRNVLAKLTTTLLANKSVHDITKLDITAALGVAQQIIARADAVT